jgi:hypothetical protein
MLDNSIINTFKEIDEKLSSNLDDQTILWIKMKMLFHTNEAYKIGKSENNKKLFNSDADKQLWIKLYTELLMAWDKKKYDNQYIALDESITILKNDEIEGKLSFTLEELTSLQINELLDLKKKRHKEWRKKTTSEYINLKNECEKINNYNK